MNSVARIMFLGWLTLWSTGIAAAPLDEFLTAMPGHDPRHGELEAGFDLMNSTVDILKIRKGSEDPRGASIGDYSGGHIRGQLALTQRLSADATLWKRAIKTPFDEGESFSYQGALQYQATVNLGWLPAVALRISGWGDSADQVLKGSPTTVFNTLTVQKIRVEDPRDRQFQGDIIGSWTVAKDTLFSLFLSMGISQVDAGDLFAELGSSGECVYKISTSDSGAILVNLTKADPGHCQLISYNDNNQNITLPDGMYIAYDARYLQLGGSLQWFTDKWRSRVGYRFQTWDRDEVDDAIRLYQHAEKIPYEVNHHLSAEVGYKILDQTGIFIRGQAMQHQFVGDVPFSYNLFSAHKFKNRYGFLTFGIVQGF